MAYQSELKVITSAKKLASYVMTITQKSPKQFRFSLVAKMQAYVLDTVENLYRAYLASRRSKRETSEVIQFEMNVGPNLCKLRE